MPPLAAVPLDWDGNVEWRHEGGGSREPERVLPLKLTVPADRGRCDADAVVADDIGPGVGDIEDDLLGAVAVKGRCRLRGRQGVGGGGDPVTPQARRRRPMRRGYNLSRVRRDSFQSYSTRRARLPDHAF
jgi:hypothetical protein